MPVETTYTSLRERLASFLDQVANDREVVIVRRRGAKDVALIPAAELEFVDAHFGFGTSLDDLLWTMRILVPPKVVAQGIEASDGGALRHYQPPVAPHHGGQEEISESRWADST